ncbi:binary toxin-like calcium binding domain-containing protein [Bacillus cereus]
MSLPIKFFWTVENKKQEIPPLQFLSPYLGTESQQHIFFPQISLFGDKNPPSDVDNDQIPDEWEISGYKQWGSSITEWMPGDEAKGYIKYVSNPFRANTAGDPYTDFEKVTNSGKYSYAGATQVTRNPLVACYPDINVEIEKFEIASTDAKQEFRTRVSETKGWSVETGASFDINKFLKISINEKGSRSSSKIHEDSMIIGETVTLSPCSAGILYLTLKCVNNGSSTSYQTQPTVNVILGTGYENSPLSIAMYKPGDIKPGLSPGSIYPEEGSVFQKSISLTYSQLTRIQAGAPLTIEVPNFLGFYQYQTTPGVILKASWDSYLTTIGNICAKITVNNGKEGIEKDYRILHFATKDRSRPANEDMTPIITLKEALKMGLNAKEDNFGNLYYIDKNGNIISIFEEAVEILFDTYTFTQFVQPQLERMEIPKLYDIVLERKEFSDKVMEINILATTMYEDFNDDIPSAELHIQESYTSGQGKEGLCFQNKYQMYATEFKNFKFEPHTEYRLSMHTNILTDSSNITESTDVYLEILNEIRTSQKRILGTLFELTSQDGWTNQSFGFVIPEEHLLNQQIGVHICKFNVSDNTKIQIDDFSITKVGNSDLLPYEIYKRHEINTKNADDYYSTSMSTVYLELRISQPSKLLINSIPWSATNPPETEIIDLPPLRFKYQMKAYYQNGTVAFANLEPDTGPKIIPIRYGSGSVEPLAGYLFVRLWDAHLDTYNRTLTEFYAIDQFSLNPKPVLLAIFDPTSNAYSPPKTSPPPVTFFIKYKYV